MHTLPSCNFFFFYLMVLMSFFSGSIFKRTAAEQVPKESNKSQGNRFPLGVCAAVTKQKKKKGDGKA